MLSSLQRENIVNSIQGAEHDIAIIGGGITGAGIALDAAARGMKVALIEKYDFASGTSSKSTKLIHGGLRYLKQLEFSLVRKVGTERAVIHRLAPHLVHPTDMLLPIRKNGTLGKFTTGLALAVYDFLAKVKKDDQFKMLGPLQARISEPLLREPGLLGAALYKEYRTDDARLTIGIIKTAAEKGALCLNYCKADKFIYRENKIAGIQCNDLITGKEMIVSAKKIINATGPWVDQVRSKDDEIKGKRLHLTKGIHLVCDHDKLPVRNAVYFDTGIDERMIFVIPRGKCTYIGTTDTDFLGDPDNIRVNETDVIYLISAVNAQFSVKLLKGDIISSWAGLRPLIHEDGKSPGELSRKDEIFISTAGLISIAGGKLTGYRKMAEEIVGLVIKQLSKEEGINYPSSSTDKIMIQGSEPEMDIDELILRRTGEAKQISVPYEHICYLTGNYGADADLIIDKAFDLYHDLKDAEERILKAELQYCIENEMVMNVSDFFIRRTGRIYFDPAFAIKWKSMVAGWITEVIPQTGETAETQLAFFDEATRASGIFI